MNTHLQKYNWLMIPFYSNPNSDSHSNNIARFHQFAENAKTISGLRLAIIDDGSRLTPDDFIRFTDLLVQLPSNQGKAVALRTGLSALLNDSELNPGYIVQYDGDGDQSFIDIPKFVDSLDEISGGNPDIPALSIGDRYSENLETSPNPNSIAYRQSLLIFFGSISRSFGFEVKDWVSGARAYTVDYARKFLERSKSDRYGIEAEELVIAYLEGASVGRVPLSHSRPRDPHTERSKWLQNFEAFLLHVDDLKKRGQIGMVSSIESLVGNLRSGLDNFNLDLRPLGEETVMQFERVGTAYRAEIPENFRRNYFSDSETFMPRKEF